MMAFTRRIPVLLSPTSSTAPRARRWLWQHRSSLACADLTPWRAVGRALVACARTAVGPAFSGENTMRIAIALLAVLLLSGPAFAQRPLSLRLEEQKPYAIDIS